MSVVRGAGLRRKARGTIHERVRAQLKLLDAARAERDQCVHRWGYSPAVRGSVCIDCGARGPQAVRS